jgi:hypothetical protein
MSSFNIDGKVVNVNDRVSIIGQVVSVSGSGGLALVTVQPVNSIVNFVCQANDAQAVEHSADANHVATSINGKAFGATNDAVTVLGYVTSISGSGNQALLSVTLATSGFSISVNAGSVRSDNV